MSIKTTKWNPAGVSTKVIKLGRNTDVLREVPTESVQLIYADPPFNSDRIYNLLVPGSPAQIKAFKDIWSVNEESDELWALFKQLVEVDPELRISPVRSAIQYVDFLLSVPEIDNSMVAYLRHITNLLAEGRRVLCSKGSLILHCDPNADGYVRMVGDIIFGPSNFISEVIWQRTSACNNALRFGPIHDTLLVYGKTKDFYWNPDVYHEHGSGYLDGTYRFTDPDRGMFRLSDLSGKGKNRRALLGVLPPPGRQWVLGDPLRESYMLQTGGELVGNDVIEDLEECFRVGLVVTDETDGQPKYKKFLTPGKHLQDVVIDIHPIHSRAKESRGFSTQKPKALIRRLIKSLSQKGDMVIDPYLGSGTTAIVCIEEEREFLGIELERLTYILAKKYIEEANGGVPIDTLVCKPQSMADAEELFKQDELAFQRWIVEDYLYGVCGPKGPDDRLDGTTYYMGFDNAVHPLALHVTGGKVTRDKIIISNSKLEDLTKQDPGYQAMCWVSFGRNFENAAKKRAEGLGTIDLGIDCADKFKKAILLPLEELMSQGIRALKIPGVLMKPDPNKNPSREYQLLVARRKAESQARDDSEIQNIVEQFALESLHEEMTSKKEDTPVVEEVTGTPVVEEIPPSPPISEIPNTGAPGIVDDELEDIILQYL